MPEVGGGFGAVAVLAHSMGRSEVFGQQFGEKVGLWSWYISACTLSCLPLSQIVQSYYWCHVYKYAQHC